MVRPPNDKATIRGFKNVVGNPRQNTTAYS